MEREERQGKGKRERWKGEEKKRKVRGKGGKGKRERERRGGVEVRKIKKSGRTIAYFKKKQYLCRVVKRIK